jgi:hypothetical protein
VKSTGRYVLPAAPAAWLALTVTCSDDGWHRASPAVPEAADPVPAADAAAVPPAVAVWPDAAPPAGVPAGVPAGDERRGRGSREHQRVTS